jgi:NAD(P) transhydrogenase
MTEHAYDLVVIGGGPAGLSGAIAAAYFGKRVALVERAPAIGGAGINTGTLPSKALRESALVMSGSRARKLLGVKIELRREAGLAEFMHLQHAAGASERQHYDERLRERGVHRVRGTARFAGPHLVRVAGEDGREIDLEGAVILIATGSSPVRPPVFPFDHPRVHDSDEILEIATLPQSLAVVGAGVIGAEYACTFAALGVETHLIDGRDRLLGFLDAEVSDALAQAMGGHGVRFHWNERVAACVAPAAGDVQLTLASGALLSVSDVLVASGRSSNTGALDLAAAGLAAGERGLLAVDAHYRTAVPHILAAGDVVGAPALAATAMEQARSAVVSAFGIMDKTAAPVTPTGIYTIPEVGCAGATEEELAKQGVAYVAGRARYAQIPRGHMIGDEEGFLKLLFRRDDRRLAGVHIMGEQATDLVHVGLMAMLAGAGIETFNRACFNYPTLGDLYKYAGYDALVQLR